jgi:hypothetical protein
MTRMHDRGSIELVVLGLLAALIVVLALPLFTAVPPVVKKQNTEARVAKVVAQDTRAVK